MVAEIQSARGCLAAVRALALSSSPEEVDRCIPQLQQALAHLQAVHSGLYGEGLDGTSLSGKGPVEKQEVQLRADLARELKALQFELGVVGRLAVRGAEFYQGWARVVATATAGYTATGDPAPLRVAQSLSVEG